MDSFAPTTLWSRVRIPSTPSTLLLPIFYCICHCVEKGTKINKNMLDLANTFSNQSYLYKKVQFTSPMKVGWIFNTKAIWKRNLIWEKRKVKMRKFTKAASLHKRSRMHDQHKKVLSTKLSLDFGFDTKPKQRYIFSICDVKLSCFWDLYLIWALLLWEADVINGIFE